MNNSEQGGNQLSKVDPNKTQDNVRDDDGSSTNVSVGQEPLENTETAIGITPDGVVDPVDTATSDDSPAPAYDLARSGDAFSHPSLGESILREFVRKTLRIKSELN